MCIFLLLMERLVSKHQGVLAILTGISGHFEMEQPVSLNWNRWLF
jgi:hypothetical protein